MPASDAEMCQQRSQQQQGGDGDEDCSHEAGLPGACQQQQARRMSFPRCSLQPGAPAQQCCLNKSCEGMTTDPGVRVLLLV